MEFLTLNTGAKMPLEGFGVFQIPEDQCEQVVYDAIKTGYRLLDTAAAYMNEEALGRGVARAIQTVLRPEKSCSLLPRSGCRIRRLRIPLMKPFRRR